jgi:hypothetical protein
MKKKKTEMILKSIESEKNKKYKNIKIYIYKIRKINYKIYIKLKIILFLLCYNFYFCLIYFFLSNF